MPHDEIAAAPPAAYVIDEGPYPVTHPNGDAPPAGGDSEDTGDWHLEQTDSRGDYWAVWNASDEAQRGSMARWPRQYRFYGTEAECRNVAAALARRAPTNNADLRARCIEAGARATGLWVIDADNPLACNEIRQMPAIVDAVLAEVRRAPEGARAIDLLRQAARILGAVSDGVGFPKSIKHTLPIQNSADILALQISNYLNDFPEASTPGGAA